MSWKIPLFAPPADTTSANRSRSTPVAAQEQSASEMSAAYPMVMKL